MRQAKRSAPFRLKLNSALNASKFEKRRCLALLLSRQLRSLLPPKLYYGGGVVGAVVDDGGDVVATMVSEAVAGGDDTMIQPLRKKVKAIDSHVASAHLVQD